IGTMPYFFAALSSRCRARSRATSSSNAVWSNRASALRTCDASWIGRRRRFFESTYANALSGRRARALAASSGTGLDFTTSARSVGRDRRSARLALWLLHLRRDLHRDLRLDPFTVRAAVVLRDLFPESRDRLRRSVRRRLAELISRSRVRHAFRHAVVPVRLPVTARTMATMSAATRTKKMIESSEAISTIGVPAGCAKIPRNGATSGSVIP